MFVRPFVRSVKNPLGVFANPRYASSWPAQVAGESFPAYVVPTSRWQDGSVATTEAIDARQADEAARYNFQVEGQHGPLPLPCSIPAYYFWRQVMGEPELV